MKIIGKNNKSTNKDIDIPTGLRSALYQNVDAMRNFESLSNIQKSNVISYVRNNDGSKEDAKQKISDIVEHLKKNSMDFIN